MAEQLYVLGHPVAHSMSPVMHNALYEALRLDWDYGLADREDGEAAERFIAAREFLGCNVTMPY